MIDWVYDIETFPNIFTIGLVNITDPEYRMLFEISWRENDLTELLGVLRRMKENGDRMIGFNNIGFDYPVIHHIMETPDITTKEIYERANAIINTSWDDRFSNVIFEPHIQQIDLYKIHHFDNFARATSLKVLEFNMRSPNISDLPYPPGTFLDFEQMDVLIDYMWDDINETVKFHGHSKKLISFREELTEKYGRDFMNHNDGKIGKDYFIMRMEQTVPSFNRKVQTKRDYIRLGDVVLPMVKFEQPEFNRILSWFKHEVITETKGSLTDINCTINGFQFDFGLGGIHGSVDPCIIESDDDYIIEDWDVASYYPNLAIANRLYPEHLGEDFCDIYADVYEMRKQYPKGTSENAMLKLALNSVYGDSNNQYSCFFDTQYTMSITVNGQLLLCMLAEQLMKGCEIIQINTDGLTVRYDRKDKAWVHSVAKWWEDLTKLTLENVEYKRMFIRDVNNYIGEPLVGKLKRKGAYEYDVEWHQKHSALVVKKAAEASLVHGTDIREFITHHPDIMDFMLCAKVNRGSRLVAVDYHGNDRPIQSTSRYYISMFGEDLIKIMPPLRGKTEDRRMSINKGWKVTECNNMNAYVEADVEFEWYIREAEQLVKPLRRSP